MKELRVAVIGCGSIANNYHLPSLKSLAECGTPIRRVAVCDLDGQRAQAAAARYGFAKSYTDYRAMLDAEAPDAIWVLVKTAAMRALAGDLLARGVPILMEKPPAENVAQARELAEIAAQHGTPHQVAFNRRYAPLLLQMKDLLAEAGGISAVSCQFYRYNRGEPDFAYGTGIHGLDAVRFLGDSEVREVHTRRGQRGSALVTLVYASGAYGTMEMLPLVGVQAERYSAHAGERTVVVDGVVSWLTFYPGFLQSFDQGKLILSIDSKTRPAPPEVNGGFYGESAAFITALSQGTPPGPDLATSLRSVQIAEAVDRGESVVFGD